MRTLERYVVFQFIKTLLGALLFFAVIITLTEVISNIDRYIGGHAPWMMIVEYHAKRAPYFFFLTFPMCVMFSATYIFGQMIKNNEMIAVHNAGVGLLQFIIPIIAFVTVICAGVVLSWEYVVAPSAQRAEVLGSEIGSGAGSDRVEVRHDIAMYGASNTTYMIDRYIAARRRLEGITLIRRNDEGDLIETLTAKSAIWQPDENAWTFYEARIQKFDPDNIDTTSIVLSRETNYPISERPFHFEDDAFPVELLSFSQDLRRIERMHDTKGNEAQVWTELFFKIAVISVSIILVALSAVFAKYSKQSVLIISLLIVLGITIVYYIVTFAGIALAKNGTIPPFLGAFVGNGMMLVASIIVFKKNTT